MSMYGNDILPSADAEELIDFTCASPWERLALDIELEFRAWGLQDGQQPNEKAINSAKTIPSNQAGGSLIDPIPLTCSSLSLGGQKLTLELRAAKAKDNLDSTPLERILGVGSCVLLTADTPDGVSADDSSDAAVLLSALSVAASACGCSLPMLVPVARPSSLQFIGRQLNPKHLRFSCDYTNHIPEEFSHLSGLLNLFRNKRTSARRLCPPTLSSAKISAKFTYDWDDFSFKLAISPDTFASDRRLSALQKPALNTSDPIRKIRVTAIWDEFDAAKLKDNEVLAAMPASTASRLRLSPTIDLLKTISTSVFPSPRIPLTNSARGSLRLAQIASNMIDHANPAAPLPLINVIQCVASNMSNQNLERSPRRTHQDGRQSPRYGRSPAATALDHFFAQVGDYVAAAAIQDDRIDEDFLTSAVAALFEMDPGRGITTEVVEALGPNAAESTLLEKLSRLVATCESMTAAQRLWNLFLDGIEVHWEQSWIICGIPFTAEDGPDHDECLLMQKLQMINCCVERKRSDYVNIRSAAHNGMGRKKKLDGMMLIGDATAEKEIAENDRTIWEPLVQPHPLSTRDMVDEELKRMVMRAENGNQDEEFESKRQALTLKSDMMSFKAANPGAILADFVRWFSPSDWIDENDDANNDTEESAPTEEVEPKETKDTPMEETDEVEVIGTNGINQKLNGRLSARMSRQGNVWEALWDEAESIPATKQIPIFDARAHGSKALADLRAMPMTQVLLHLAAIQGSSAVSVLQYAFTRGPSLPTVRLRIEGAKYEIKTLCANLRLDRAEVSDLGQVATALDVVAQAEHMALVATSILTKLPPADGMGPIVDHLASGEMAEVTTETEKRLLIRMAGLDDDVWRNVLLPEWREFIIRGADDNDDRMYARLSHDEFRVGFRLNLDYSV